MTEEAVVDIYGQYGMILLGDKGKLYTSQTGGCCCDHPQARGMFIGLDLATSVWHEIMKCAYDRCVWEEEMNEVFQKHNLPFEVIDTDSMEAWVHVKLSNGGEGILVWPNSD